MGLRDTLKRRRERESAVPNADVEALTAKLQGDGEPIGQPVGQVQPGADSQINLGGADLGSIFSMIGQAVKTGNVQITQGESHVIDLRGTDLSKQIRSVMGQHGIDLDNQSAEQYSQLTAQDGMAIQSQMLDVLKNAGIDVDQISQADETAADTPADAAPGGGGED